MKKSYTLPALLLSVSFVPYAFGIDSVSERSHSFYESAIITNEVDYFTDLSAAHEGEISQAAHYLYNKSIIGGRPDGSFDPEAFVNRAEMAKFLLLSKGVNVESYQDPGGLKDVKRSEWYAPYVLKAAEIGVINGYPSGVFAPAKTVNRAEFSKMLVETFDEPMYENNDSINLYEGIWYEPYIEVVKKYQLLDDLSEGFDPGAEMTRAEVAVALYRYLHKERATNQPKDVVRYPDYENQNYTSTSSQEVLSSNDLRIRKLGSHVDITVDKGEKTKVLSLQLESQKENTIESIRLRRIGATGEYEDFTKIWAVINNSGNSESGYLNSIEMSRDVLVKSDEVVVPIETKLKSNNPVIIDFYAEVSENASRTNQSRWVLYLPEWIDSETTQTKTGFFPLGGYDIEVGR